MSEKAVFDDKVRPIAPMPRVLGRGGIFLLAMADRKLRDVIVSKMPPDQTPNYYFVGAVNPKFEAQSPFTV